VCVAECVASVSPRFHVSSLLCVAECVAECVAVYVAVCVAVCVASVPRRGAGPQSQTHLCVLQCVSRSCSVKFAACVLQPVGCSACVVVCVLQVQCAS